jgi:hypothetical protein
MIAHGYTNPDSAPPALPRPAFGDGYYAPRNMTRDGHVERVLRWEGEL